MAAAISDKARFWNHPLLPIALLLFTLGVRNWWFSRSKVIEYSQRLAAWPGLGDSDLTEYAHLDARTNTSLLRRLHQVLAP